MLKKTIFDEGGFTLLEVIISTAIFSVIALILGSSMFCIQQTWKTVSKKSVELEELYILDRVFDSAFRNAIPFNWKDENNSELLLFAGKTDSILIPYLHRIIEPEDGAIRFLKLFREKDKLVAEYHKEPILSLDVDCGKVEREVLANNVKEVLFTYARMNDNKIFWSNEWSADNVNIPLAVQIKIIWNNGEEEQWLRRTAGSGYFELLGKRKDSNG